MAAAGGSAFQKHLEGLITYSFQFADAKLMRGITPDTLIQIVRKLDEVAKGENERALGQIEEGVKQGVKKPVACKAGCCYCCHQMLSPTIPEVLSISRHVSDAFSGEQRAALLEAIGEYERYTQPFRGGKEAFYNRPCVFLDDRGFCSIYEFRPFKCRKFHSTDLDACIAFVENRLEDFNARLPGLTHPEFSEPYVALMKGFRIALHKHKLDHNFHDMLLSLRICLEEPSSGDRYCARENVFAVARKDVLAGAGELHRLGES